MSVGLETFLNAAYLIKYEITLMKSIFTYFQLFMAKVE